MTDERDKELDPDAPASNQATPPAPVVDDWASAFAAIEDKTAADAPGDPAGDSPGAAPSAVSGLEGGSPAPGAVPGDGDALVGSGDAGGSLPVGDDAGTAGGEGDLADVSAAIERYETEINQRAIDDTARMFLEVTDEQGRKKMRQTNGQLGATINDPDVYRVGEDGTAAFYNPDTGRPFTGDNPRAQAKAWVEEYNDELRETFDRMAGQRKAAVEAEMAPVIEVLKFTPTYDALDTVRKSMLDALLEDYEVYDNAGKHLGYSVDLNKALAQVNKQVAAIQAGRPPKESTGPAVDMPTVGGGDTVGASAPKDLSDAMERLQNEQLAKLKK